MWKKTKLPAPCISDSLQWSPSWANAPEPENTGSWPLYLRHWFACWLWWCAGALECPQLRWTCPSSSRTSSCSWSTLWKEGYVTFKNEGLEVSGNTRVGAGTLVASVLNPNWRCLIKLASDSSSVVGWTGSSQYVLYTWEWTGSQRLGDGAKGMCRVNLRGGRETSLFWQV